MRHRYQGCAPGFYKIRGLNNFHHAKDAYLTAVLGQFTTYACPFWGNDEENRDIKRLIMRPDNTEAQVRDLVNRRYGIVLDLFACNNSDKFMTTEDGEFLWDETRRGNVFATMAKNTCNVVKKQEPYASASFYDQTIHSPRSGKKKLQPLKYRNGQPMPTELYGGYSSLNPAYFVIVEKDGKKGSRELVFGMIPVIVQTAGKEDDYIRETYGKNAVVRRIVRKFQPVIYGGQLCRIVAEGEIQNATELYVSSAYERLLYIADKNDVKAYERDVEKNDAMFMDFAEHYCSKVRRFYPLYERFADKVEYICANKFPVGDTAEKLKLLRYMMLITNTNSKALSLDANYGGGQFGRLNGKTIYPSEVVWVDVSLTGLRVRERKEEV